MKYISFDDVLIKPKYSEINSRHDVDISSKLGKFNFSIPVVSSPMSRVTSAGMAALMARLGGLGIIHRFNSPSEQKLEVNAFFEKFGGKAPLAVAVGFKDFEERISLCSSADIVCIDVANGHTLLVKETVKKLKSLNPDVLVIAGNIATADAAKDLESWGVDVLRCGIGGGHFCRTRDVTGIGVPAVSMLQQIRPATKLPIVYDGGIRTSGDIAKALLAGADFVMIGNLLAGTSETPGDIFERKDGSKYKICYGMSSREAHRRDDVASEGVCEEISFKGSAEQIISDLAMGIKSSLSYVGAKNLKEFREKGEFIKVSYRGLVR